MVGVCAASTPAALGFLELLAKQPAACKGVARKQAILKGFLKEILKGILKGFLKGILSGF